jgi:flavin-dependent dehydrogenase
LSRKAVSADVCVIGGGPAGSVFARRMALLGHDVVLLERYRDPRPRIGEALAAGIWPQLKAIGAAAEIANCRQVQIWDSSVRWAGATTGNVHRPGPPSVIVDRGEFDRVLLEQAMAAGVTVLAETTAKRPRRRRDGWSVGGASGDTPTIIHARFVADASGRAKVLGGATARSTPTLCLHSRWRGRLTWPARALTEATSDGWLWGAPLPDGTFRSMLFIDADLLRRRGINRSRLNEFFRLAHSSSRLFRTLPRHAEFTELEACDATRFSDPEPIGEAFVKLGEASQALDPLSSMGVQKAIQSAVAGAAAAHTILSGGDAQAAVEFFRADQQASHREHESWIGEYSAQPSPGPKDSFWRRRRSAQPPAQRPRVATVPLGRLRLSPAVRILPTPCIVGDRVEMRPAVHHPNLKRPVAYLGGIELAPLLTSPWPASLPAPKAAALATWLVSNEILVPR